MVAQSEGRSPMTSSDAETDTKPIIITIILFNFARKALIQVLPTAANLKRWNNSPGRLLPALCEGNTANKQTRSIQLQQRHSSAPIHSPP